MNDKWMMTLKWMKEWMNEQMYEWMNEWMNESKNERKKVVKKWKQKRERKAEKRNTNIFGPTALPFLRSMYTIAPEFAEHGQNCE